MTTFIGLDLAWTPHHETGICVIEGHGHAARLVVLEARIGTVEWFAQLCCSFGEDVVVAIDAPLIVGPGRRAERELAAVFGAAKASAYTASPAFLARMNGMAGPDLAALLRTRGFQVVPSALIPRAGGRVAVEVFPHPAHVELFGLAERIPYKKGRIAERRAAFALYQDYLRALIAREIPGLLDDTRLLDVLSRVAAARKGKALKAVEDQLDAVTCAYVAHHCWLAPGSFRVFGDDGNGAIVVPLARGAGLHALRGGHPHEAEHAGQRNARGEHQP